jgi:hypothetical protein
MKETTDGSVTNEEVTSQRYSNCVGWNNVRRTEAGVADALLYSAATLHEACALKLAAGNQRNSL